MLQEETPLEKELARLQREMNVSVKEEDKEAGHVKADSLLCQLVEALLPLIENEATRKQAERILARYRKVEGWYA